MEYELTIKGTAAEMERIFRLLKQPDTPSSVESEVNLDVVALDFVKNLSPEATQVLRLLVDATISGTGLPERDIAAMRDKPPYGVMGGLGRRWSSIAGLEFGTPFRKQGSGGRGIYQLDQPLAASLSIALGD